MKHIIKYLIAPIAFFFLALGVGNGQDCYELLEDPSGYNSGALNTTIEAAACELRAALPTEFQADFKVYDAGFYIETEVFGSSEYKDRFNDLKAEAASKSTYYLLFGRKCNTKGLNVDVYADLVLPTTGEMVCLNESLQTLNLSIHTYKMQEDLEGIKASEQYVPAVLNFISNVANDINESVVCCDTITEKYEEDCDDNCMNGQVLIGALKGIGFDQIISDSIIITNTTYSGGLESDYGIIFQYKSGSYAYTDELNDFINEIGGDGKVRMYNDSTCENFDFNLLLDGGFSENVVIIDKDGTLAVLMRPSSNGDALISNNIDTRSVLLDPITALLLKKIAVAAANGAVAAMFEAGFELGMTMVELNTLSFTEGWNHVKFDKTQLAISAAKEAAVSLIFGTNKAVDFAADVLVDLAQKMVEDDHATYDLQTISQSITTAAVGALVGESVGRLVKRMTKLFRYMDGERVFGTVRTLETIGFHHYLYNLKSFRTTMKDAFWRMSAGTDRGFLFEELLLWSKRYIHLDYLGSGFPTYDYHDVAKKQLIQLKTTSGSKIPKIKKYFEDVMKDVGKEIPPNSGNIAKNFKMIVIAKNATDVELLIAQFKKDRAGWVAYAEKFKTQDVVDALNEMEFDIDVWEKLD